MEIQAFTSGRTAKGSLSTSNQMINSLLSDLESHPHCVSKVCRVEINCKEVYVSLAKRLILVEHCARILLGGDSGHTAANILHVVSRYFNNV